MNRLNGTKKLSNFVISLCFALALFFFIMTFSIGLPIYFRPFYYAHIDALHLDETSGFTKEEIQNAYDEVLDYLTLPGHAFSSGVMKYSDDGAAHFRDCKALFTLNLAVFLASAAVLLLFFAATKKVILKNIEIHLRKGTICAGICSVFLPLIIGSAAALNFDRAFTVFHKLLFPGKENWIFNPRTDEIIRVLPQQFFMNCAILIGTSVITLSAITVILSLRKKRRQ